MGKIGGVRETGGREGEGCGNDGSASTPRYDVPGMGNIEAPPARRSWEAGPAGPGQSVVPERELLDAGHWGPPYRVRGRLWRDLPPDYGDWNNTHHRFGRWRDRGVWEELLDRVIDDPDYEWLMVDATYIKVHSHGTGARGGNQEVGRTKGG